MTETETACVGEREKREIFYRDAVCEQQRLMQLVCEIDWETEANAACV